MSGNEPNYTPVLKLAPTGSGNSGRGIRTGSGFADDDEIRDIAARIGGLSRRQMQTLRQYVFESPQALLGEGA